ALAASVGGLGVTAVPDPAAGLNAAVTAGLDSAAARWPEAARAVLLADVPALRPGDLASALGAAAAYPRSFVPDHTGTGTVLLTARAGEPLVPHFGADSARRHTAAGAVRLDLDLPGLRTDVDDAASLALVLALGAGPRVAALAREAGLL
ncbi:MAG TPA: hypothetical protein VHM65_00575, partial [Candidatus Lustribacter sp.]|nr:hypothetical protein [Candidatus Lustribacter sp.]